MGASRFSREGENSTLELRVHTGVHAGASERLAQDRYSIGPDLDSELVISDFDTRAAHALLSHTENHWVLCQGEDETQLDYGTLFPLGGLWFSIAPHGADWPTRAELEKLLDMPRDDGHLREDEADPDREDIQQPASLRVSAHQGLAIDAQPATPPRFGFPLLARNSGARRLFFASLVGISIFAVTWSLMPPGSISQETQTVTASPPQDVPSVTAQIATILKVVQSLGITRQVTCQADSRGIPVVKASLIKEADYEALAMALSNLSPRPALEVITEEAVVRQMREMLRIQSMKLKTELNSDYLGNGNFRITGKLASDEQRDMLLASLASALPDVIQITSSLSVPKERAMEMLAVLQASTVAQVQGEWRHDKLEMKVKLSRSDLGKWEQFLQSAAKDFDVPFTIRAVWLPEPLLPAALARLPFKIQAIVSGETPYVVLHDGNKLLLEGKVQGWRLVSVDAANVVFEDYGTQRVVIRR